MILIEKDPENQNKLDRINKLIIKLPEEARTTIARLSLRQGF